MGKVIKSFRMGDLCEYIKVRKAQKKNVRTEKNHEFCIPVVYAKFGDNGIMYWGRKGEFDTHSNVISIVYNGAIAAGKVYAQEEETGILAEAYLIRVKNGETIPFRSIQYLAFSIEKVIYPKYSRDLLATWENRVENDIIPLPVQTDAEESPIIDPERKYHAEGYIPDWSYMQERIAELEQERIAGLEQFLIASGLNDYELNDEDNAALNRRMSETNTIHHFRLDYLFDIKTAKSIDRNKIVFDDEGEYDFIGRSSVNYGIQGKIGHLRYEPNAANTFSLVQVGESCCLFRETPWYASQNIFILKPRFPELVDVQLYITCVLNKSLKIYKDAYKYPTLSVLKEIKIQLPVSYNGIPDWDYMTAYIRAMKKVVIADVVKYKDEALAKTRSLVSP